MWYNCYSFVNNTSNIGRIGYILYVLADITKRPVVLRVGFSFHFLCYFIDCYGEFAIHNVFSFDVNDFHFFFYFSCLFVIKFIYFDLRLFFHFPFLNDFLYVFLHLGSWCRIFILFKQLFILNLSVSLYFFSFLVSYFFLFFPFLCILAIVLLFL